ncbi:flavin reductase [Clostridium sp. Ade.TY]|uniref:flavin reductase n=1 Tax=Clostridium sp. Ade.TY TaxID=1391647 RepID=UPI0003FEA879|nr:flavin reductase [Clostridium sp. Ade.TY]
MDNFKEIQPSELNESPFKLIGEDWMLITAEKNNKINTMTASWGGLGVMWGKNVTYIVVRPNRYTKEFIDNSDTFSLTFFDTNFKKQLGYLGSVSGRDEDKISKSNLTVSHIDNTPYFEEGKLVMVCKKLYSQPLKPEFFLENGIDERWYPQKDYHELYISEIKKIISK